MEEIRRTARGLTARSHTHLAGVLGWPLDHTLSPVIHNAAFRHLALDWIYLAFPVAPDDLGDAVAGLRALGAMGANVTMPHKEEVVNHLDDVSGDARAVGAVNTIQNVAGRLIGHNTDVDGFRGFVESDAGIEVAGRDALVIGAGGAARGVLRALGDLGVAKIGVAARRPELAEALVDIPARSGVEVVPWDDASKWASKADLVVNCTPLGMNGEDPVPDTRFRGDQCVIDLVYDPPATPLLERARAAGADAWGGLGMLVHQAAASFVIWTGQDPPLQVMSAAAIRAIGHSDRHPD